MSEQARSALDMNGMRIGNISLPNRIFVAPMAGVIDRPFTFLDRRTPSYTAIMERDGNLVIALASLSAHIDQSIDQGMFGARRVKTD